MLDYCPDHELAWVPPGYTLRTKVRTPGHWTPLARWKLMEAVTLAQVFSCQAVLRIHRTACPRCRPHTQEPKE